MNKYERLARAIQKILKVRIELSEDYHKLQTAKMAMIQVLVNKTFETEEEE